MGERLRGDDRERRRGDRGDLLLKGERLILRRAANLGLVSLDRSRPLSKSGRGRFLWEVIANDNSHTVMNDMSKVCTFKIIVQLLLLLYKVIGKHALREGGRTFVGNPACQTLSS